MSNPLADMEQPDVIFCIGTNMTVTHPVAATRLKKAMRRGAKLIVADPRRIPLAEQADVFLPLRVGSDVALLGAMAHVIAREGLVDRAFIEERTEGYRLIAIAHRAVIVSESRPNMILLAMPNIASSITPEAAAPLEMPCDSRCGII